MEGYLFFLLVEKYFLLVRNRNKASLIPNIFYFSMPWAFSCHPRCLPQNCVSQGSSQCLTSLKGLETLTLCLMPFLGEALLLSYLHYFLSHTLRGTVYLNNHQTLLRRNVLSVYRVVNLKLPLCSSWRSLPWFLTMDVKYLGSCACSYSSLPHFVVPTTSCSLCNKIRRPRDPCIGCFIMKTSVVRAH